MVSQEITKLVDKMKEGNVVVKITMPKMYADKFLNESEKRFGDSRFVHILFKEEMYEALRDTMQPDKQEAIEMARVRVINTMANLYNDNKIRKEMN